MSNTGKALRLVDVPEQGKEAVENLTNAGLYVPEDNTVFGPDELMTEQQADP